MTIRYRCICLIVMLALYEVRAQSLCEIANERPPKPTKQSEHVYDCSDQTDGFYAFNNCSKYYAFCAQGEFTEFVCTGGFAFDAVSRKCKSKSSIDGCIALEPKIVNGHLYDCSDKKDGPYAVSVCSRNYAICAQGEDIMFLCTGGLAFDPVSKQCKQKSSIDGCYDK